MCALIPVYKIPLLKEERRNYRILSYFVINWEDKGNYKSDVFKCTESTLRKTQAEFSNKD